MNLAIILFGKLFSFVINNLNLGNGSTWPGHIALNLNKNFIHQALKNSKTKIIIISGTNGKTTTGKLISHLLNNSGKTTLENTAGANLLNGLSSTIIKGSSLTGKLESDYLIFEADENALPLILKQVSPNYLICLNLFRDQLDRYGEIDTIAKKWKKAFANLNKNTTLILNADDPQIAYLAKDVKAKVEFFGLNEKNNITKLKHGADSTFCPNCSEPLLYESVYFSHLGLWKCSNCKLERPKIKNFELATYPLVGTYNKYNTQAAVLVAGMENIKVADIIKALQDFKPAFGRGEKIDYQNKQLQIFLSKNPTSFNESLQTIKELSGQNILIVLNDRIPDGLDISWIWDINFENIVSKNTNIGVSGDRVWDMSLRLKHAGLFAHSDEDLKNIIEQMCKNMEENETLYILANYSAMLDSRKILTGKKLL